MVDHCGSYLLVLSSVWVEANNRPLVVTREVEGSARFCVDNNVGVSRFNVVDWHIEYEDGGDRGSSGALYSRKMGHLP